MLADLELGQVETEGLDLPDEVLQLAVREAPVARGDQRLANEAQVIASSSAALR